MLTCSSVQDHLEFHASPLSKEELDEGQTRFYRWHCDAPLYEKFPGKATLLFALQVPEAPPQKIKFEDGQVLELDAGATACKCRLGPATEELTLRRLYDGKESQT